MKTKSTKRRRTTVAERAEQRACDLSYARADGIRIGEKQAQEKFDADLRTAERKAAIALAQSLGQMIEATARAVITFCGEVGLSK